MAKLFNKIRKQLINDKPSTTRTANYLKYAIGEIILVVVGILIALSINNWNEQQKLKSKEKSVLENLREDLRIDYDHFQENRLLLVKQLNLIDELINDAKSSVLAKTELQYLRYGVTLYPNSFENGIPVGINNPEIVELLKSYYREQKETLKSANIYLDVEMDVVRPFLRQYGIQNPKAVQKGTDSLGPDILIEAKLSRLYDTDELGQILFEIRIKTAEFIYYIDRLIKANQTLKPSLTAYIE